jgi:hypothetical protein
MILRDQRRASLGLSAAHALIDALRGLLSCQVRTACINEGGAVRTSPPPRTRTKADHRRIAAWCAACAHDDDAGMMADNDHAARLIARSPASTSRTCSRGTACAARAHPTVPAAAFVQLHSPGRIRPSEGCELNRWLPSVWKSRPGSAISWWADLSGHLRANVGVGPL